MVLKVRLGLKESFLLRLVASIALKMKYLIMGAKICLANLL